MSVACQYDDSLGQSSSNVSFTPVPNTQYYVMVSEGPPDVGVVGLSGGGRNPVAVPLANDATLVLNFNRGNTLPFIDSVQPVTAAPQILPELIISGAGFADGALVNLEEVGYPINTYSQITPTSTAPNQVIVNLLDLPDDFFLPTTLAVTVTNPSAAQETSNAAFLPVTTQNTSFTLSESDFTSSTGVGFPLLATSTTTPFSTLSSRQMGRMSSSFWGMETGLFNRECRLPRETVRLPLR